MSILKGCLFASDTCLGNKSGIGAFSIISNTTVIGNNVMMARECIINPSNHKMDDISRPMNQQGFEPVRPVIIDDDVWIGSRAIILPGVHIYRGGRCCWRCSDARRSRICNCRWSSCKNN